MQIKANSKIVFIGDSITDAGRGKNHPGEGLFDAYGNGYVALVKGLLDSTYPPKRLRVVNKGISGNQVPDLAARWKADVLDLEPDVLSIMIGINDVWRQFDSPLITDNHVAIDRYEKLLRELIEKARAQPQLKTLVLCTPYVIEGLKDDAMRAMMSKYAAVVKRLAEENNAILVDTQAAFDAYLKHYHSASLAWDRIHPNTSGHMILAKAWLNAVGFDWHGG